MGFPRWIKLYMKGGIYALAKAIGFFSGLYTDTRL